jgi:hypothetical protein
VPKNSTIRRVCNFAPKLADILIVVALAGPAWSQARHVDPSNSYHRVICIVPMVGSGTASDPKRPMYAPLPSQIGRDKSGILAYYHELTDDGQNAIVVYVAATRTALAPILPAGTLPPGLTSATATSPGPTTTVSAASSAKTSTPTNGAPSASAVQVFELGFTDQATVESALKAVKKNFDWNRFAVRVP